MAGIITITIKHIVEYIKLFFIIQTFVISASTLVLGITIHKLLWDQRCAETWMLGLTPMWYCNLCDHKCSVTQKAWTGTGVIMYNTILLLMFSGTKAWTETDVILYGHFVQSDMMAWTESDWCNSVWYFVHSDMEGLNWNWCKLSNLYYHKCSQWHEVFDWDWYDTLISITINVHSDMKSLTETDMIL